MPKHSSAQFSAFRSFWPTAPGEQHSRIALSAHARICQQPPAVSRLPSAAAEVVHRRTVCRQPLPLMLQLAAQFPGPLMLQASPAVRHISLLVLRLTRRCLHQSHAPGSSSALPPPLAHLPTRVGSSLLGCASGSAPACQAAWLA